MAPITRAAHRRQMEGKDAYPAVSKPPGRKHTTAVKPTTSQSTKAKGPSKAQLAQFHADINTVFALRPLHRRNRYRPPPMGLIRFFVEPSRAVWGRLFRGIQDRFLLFSHGPPSVYKNAILRFTWHGRTRFQDQTIFDKGTGKIVFLDSGALRINWSPADDQDLSAEEFAGTEIRVPHRMWTMRLGGDEPAMKYREGLGDYSGVRMGL